MRSKVSLLLTIVFGITIVISCAPAPTDTPVPTAPVETPIVLASTDTPVPPPPTRTPRPTNTAAPTNTPVPPTETPTEPPTETVAPPTEPPAQADATVVQPTEVPTATPTELPTDTPIPTDTPVPPPAIEEDMVEIPGGPFTMGSDVDEKNEAPAYEVDLPTFYIDRFEVNNAQFAAFVQATGYQTLLEREGNKKTWRAYAEGKDLNPVVKVAWADAVAYCEWLGKRLPTEVEWEKAARGTDDRTFPWGNERDPTRCNAKASGLRSTVAGGSFGSGASPYGIEDMAGNVWEWTSSPFQAYPGSTYQDPFYNPAFRVTRGGGWFDESAQLRVANRSAATQETANDDLGFRCVK